MGYAVYGRIMGKSRLQSLSMLVAAAVSFCCAKNATIDTGAAGANGGAGTSGTAADDGA